MNRLGPTTLVLALAFPALVAGCGPSDPGERILSERTKWKVDLQSWSATEEGQIVASVRVSGPVRSELRRLSVRCDFLDAQGARLAGEWRVLDLSDVARGAPEDMLLRLTPPEGQIDGLTINIVYEPTPEELPHIVELNDAG